MEKPKILVVDDEENIRVQFTWALARDYTVLTAAGREDAMLLVTSESPPVVLLDLGLPPDTNGVREGMLALEQIMARDPMAKVIVITGHSDRETAVRAVHLGAYDYYYKPIDMEEIRVIVSRALHLRTLEIENAALKRKEGAGRIDQIIGSSRPMAEVSATIHKVAATDATVLIVGESGTGKELVARAIHQQSLRHDKPFIPINCGAIPENLMESELFGAEKGAYTGAHAQRKGKVEYAEEGTLFLDEIGELPPALQVKLLRFLQERCIERVGGRESIEVNTRIVAATNMDLKKAVSEGRFREDLYYRLSVVTIPVPPLRNREDDVLLLARAFFQRYVKETGRTILKGLSREAVQIIYTYSWPGNVRELENRIKRAVIMAEKSFVEPEDLDITPTTTTSPLALKEAKEKLEIDLIRRALAKNDGNITHAARDLEISRTSLHDLMNKYQIKYEIGEE